MFDPQVLRERYLKFERFAFSRINVERRVWSWAGSCPRSGQLRLRRAEPAADQQERRPAAAGDWVLALTFDIEEPADVTDASRDEELADVDASTAHIPGHGIDVTV